MTNRLTKVLLASTAVASLLTTAAVAEEVIPPSWGLDRIDQQNLPLDNKFVRNNRGAGVKVYVIDTGILSSHAEFAGRILPGYSAVNDGRGTEDCHGHGTHVTGIIAGATYGVAPEALIVPVRVFGCTNSGLRSTVIDALGWVYKDYVPGTPAVANISFSTPRSQSMDYAITQLVDRGMTVVVSAGNNRTDACSYSPGAAPAAITVAASTKTDTRLSISNFGSCVDIFAPGETIISSWYTSATASRSGSGTSQAAPHVAGVAALALSADPSLSPSQVEHLIKKSASMVTIQDAGVNSPSLLLNSNLVERVDAPLVTLPPVTENATTTTSSTIPSQRPQARYVEMDPVVRRLSGTKCTKGSIKAVSYSRLLRCKVVYGKYVWSL
jgi:subtilisin family serine protease